MIADLAMRWWAQFRFGWVRYGPIGRTRRTLRSIWFVRQHNAAIARRDPAAAALCFYPDVPSGEHAIAKIAAQLRLRITRSPESDHGAAFAWSDNTSVPARTMARLPPSAINIQCLDISKSTVDRIWHEVSGRALSIDPLGTSGPIVVKSEANATHDGRIVAGPLSRREPGVVYQRLVDNRIGNEVVDLRPVIVDGAIIMTYRKWRPVQHRFSNRNSHVGIEDGGVFSADEINEIERFTARIGLDYGEIDVLRDTDGMTYVVDVAKTPFGPPNGLSAVDAREAVQRMAAAFDRVISNRSRAHG